MAESGPDLCVILNYFMLIRHRLTFREPIHRTPEARLNFMKSNSNKPKSTKKIRPDQNSPNPGSANVLDTFKTITFSAQVPEGIDPTLLERLAHDLHSAANAFSFLVDQMASELENSTDDRQRRKLNQLRQHDAMNKNCINAIATCFRSQIIKA